jgi:tetratricopeptide (TPR) repeat protein
MINSDLGKLLYFGRLYDEAEAQLKETLQMDPDFMWAHLYLARVYIKKQRFDEAIAEFKLAEANGEGDRGWTAYAYGMSGKKVEAAQMLAELRKFVARRGDVDKACLAWAYIGAGDKNRAIAYLEQDCENHGVAMTSLKSNPEYDSLRSEPRFVDLMRRVHLAP